MYQMSYSNNADLSTVQPQDASASTPPPSSYVSSAAAGEPAVYPDKKHSILTVRSFFQA